MRILKIVLFFITSLVINGCSDDYPMSDYTVLIKELGVNFIDKKLISESRVLGINKLRLINSENDFDFFLTNNIPITNELIDLDFTNQSLLIVPSITENANITCGHNFRAYYESKKHAPVYYYQFIEYVNKNGSEKNDSIYLYYSGIIVKKIMDSDSIVLSFTIQGVP